MDISSWGWGQLLELPDHLFGRRFCVGCAIQHSTPGLGFDISVTALPEKIVIWEAVTCISALTADFANISLALGDHLPANDAEFDDMEQLFPDLGFLVGRHREIYGFRNCSISFNALKTGVETVGRRLVLRYDQTLGEASLAQVGLVVSAVPRSLPEWFA